MIKSRIYYAWKNFWNDTRGVISVEIALILPLLIWTFAAIATFFDAYRSRSIAEKAAYTVSDMLSRETNAITDTYIDNTLTFFDALADSQTGSSLRVSVISWNSAMNSYEIDWSEARGAGFLALDNDDVDDDEVEDAIGRRSQTHMSRPRFFRSMFEFVDLWTETSDAHEYVAFLRNLIRRITHLRPVFIYVKQENGYAALTQLLLSTSVSGYLQASGGRRKTWNQRYIRFKGAMLQVKGTIRMSLLASIAREEKIAAEKAAEEARLAAIRQEEERKQRAKNVEGAGKALFTATQLAGAYKLASGASMHDLHGLISEGAEEANKALEDALTKEAAKHDFFPDLEVVETGDEDTNNATTPEVNQTETGTVTAQEPGPGADKPLAESAQDAEDRNVVDVVVPSNTGTDVDKNGPAADSALETGDIVDGEVIPKAESDDTDENAAATDSPKDQAVSAEKSATAAAGAEGEGGDAGDSDTEQDADDSEDGSDTFDEDASLDDEANERAQRREAQKRIRNALLDGAQTMSSSRPFARRNNLHFDWARRILCVDDPDNPSRDTAGSDSDSDEAVLGTFKLPLQKLKAPLSKLAGRRSTFVQQAATIQNRSVSCF